MQIVHGDGIIDMLDLLRLTKGINAVFNQATYVMNEYPIGTNLYLKMVKDGEYKQEVEQTNVTWASDNENVAVIDSQAGLLNIVGAGKATITATTADNNTDTLVIFGVADTKSKEYAGVTITKDDFTRKVELTVDSSNMESRLAAISADVMINSIGSQVPTITIETPGWEITKTNYSNGKLSLIAELTDEELARGESAIPLERLVRIKIIIPEQLINDPFYGAFTEIVLDTTTFKITDINNNVINLLEDYDLATKGNFGLILPYTAPIRGNTVRAQLKGNTIYSKINGTNNGTKSYATVNDFADCIDIREPWTAEFVSVEGNRELVEMNEKLGKLKCIILSFENPEDMPSKQYERYDVVELGDICKDTNYEIDINDVNYLRRAIVGEFKGEAGYPDNFVLEATDINNSNESADGTRNLGDIGDVIAIRQRIINMKWSDLTD